MSAFRVVLCLVLGVPVALLALPSRDPTEGEFPSYAHDAGSANALAQLEGVLDETRRAWNPRVKARIARRARARLDVIGPPLLWMLSTPRHQRLADAIELAVELEFDEAHDALAKLARAAPIALQPVALRAAARFRPWPPEQLVEFFRSGDVTMRSAAVELAGAAPDKLLSEIFTLLADPEAPVRDAALAAIPDRLPSTARQELMELAKFAEQAPEIMYLRALGKAQIDPETEAFLVDKLRMGRTSTRAAVLDVLASKGRPLLEPRWVRDLATHMADNALEQARAWRCIEQTQSYTVDDIRRDLSFVQDPLTRLFAARCLIRAGDKLGAEMLVDLLADRREQAPTNGKGDELAGAVRRLLGQLSGSAVPPTVPGWRDWLFALEDLPAVELDPSELTL